jgi:hypothetical protein
MSSIILPPNPSTCQVELEDPGKAYKAVIRSVGNKFEAFLNGLSREKINFIVYRKNVGSLVGGTKLVWLGRGFM